MINFLFLTVPTTASYQSLEQKMDFPEDIFGVSNWVMKFPLIIYTSDLKEKHVFTEGNVEVSKCSSPNLEERWKYFVMTKANGSRYYCTSHVFYQKSPLLKKQVSMFLSRGKATHSYHQFYLPKCLVLLSQQPYFKIQTNLIKIYRELRKNNKQISHEVNCFLYDKFERLALQGKTEEWNQCQIKSEGRSFFCPIEVAFNYYVQACNSHTGNSAIYLNKQQKIQVLHLYWLPESSLYQLNYFFHLPISGHTLSTAISAILQEKQIIFTSYNQNSNVMVMETLLSMIMPLKWHFLYVPNLPMEMIEAAQQCFMPMIIGIHKKYINLLTDKTDKIIIHVDTNSVQGEEYLNELPNNIVPFLKAIPLYSPNRRYLEWEKDVRICSILMVTEMLCKVFNMDSENKRVSSQKNVVSQNIFYNEFKSKSMMYQKLREDIEDPLFDELSFLLKIYPKQREIHLNNTFKKLLMDISQPTIYNNQKEWIRYYYNYNEKRKQIKDFKKSLIFDFSSSSTNQSKLSSKNGSLRRFQVESRRGGLSQNTIRL